MSYLVQVVFSDETYVDVAASSTSDVVAQSVTLHSILQAADNFCNAFSSGAASVAQVGQDPW